MRDILSIEVAAGDSLDLVKLAANLRDGDAMSIKLDRVVQRSVGDGPVVHVAELTFTHTGER